MTRSARISGAAVGVTLSIVAMITVDLGLAQSETPTFAQDVAPIFYARCVSCHRPGEMAPMSLLTYAQTRPWARAIRTRVLDRTMPPWHADAPLDEFANDRRLRQREIETIVRWVDGGALQGDATRTPPPPTYADGWTLGTPDLVLTSDEFKVPPTGTIPMQDFVLPTHLTKDRWLRGVELRPGNRAVVHHVVAIAMGETTDRSVPMKELQQDFLGASGPGVIPALYTAGTGKLLPARSRIVLQLHYTANGTAVSDRTRLGLYFTNAPPNRMVRSHMFMNRNFRIPAGHSHYEITTSWVVDDDIHLVDIAPHMHLRGKDFTFTLTRPDGGSIDLLRVPKYDFFWQLFYTFRNPVAVLKGSRIDAIGHFDNSPANKNNPDPTVDVMWGEQTWEEMMAGWITFTRDTERIPKS